MSHTPPRAALGEGGFPGHLYDAATDNILPVSVLGAGVAPNAWKTTPVPGHNARTTLGDTYEDKLQLLEIPPEQAASVVSGSVHPKGCGIYLQRGKATGSVKQASVLYTVTTFKDELNFHELNAQALGAWNADALRHPNATHLVLGVEWGIRTVVEFSYHVQDEDNLAVVERSLEHLVKDLKASVGTQRIELPTCRVPPTASSLKFDITTYSDICNEDGLWMGDIDQVIEFLRLVPDHIKHMNGGRGQPLSYHLFPLEMVRHMIPSFTGQFSSPCPPIHPDPLNNLTQLFDDLAEGSRRLADHQLRVSQLQDFVSQRHLINVGLVQNAFSDRTEMLSSNYRQALKDVRGGAKDQEALVALYRDFVGDELNPLRKLAEMYGELQKAEFANDVVIKGGKYVGYSGASLKKLTQGSEVYVFNYSKQLMQESESWEPNKALVYDLLGQGSTVVIVDCDATGTITDDALVSMYKNGKEVCADVLKRQEFLADRCFARYREKTIETGEAIQKPIKRRLVNIPCPDRQCAKNGKREWLCDACHHPLEYGFSDDYLYCDCGRSHYGNFDFKCNSSTHGPGYQSYKAKKLERLLKSLDPGNYINILILGETGVGKSTFINAFVNYLAYTTLDDALAAEKLEWVIPCSFSTQIMDRENPGRGIQEHVVKVGEERDDEHDGSKGESATQKTAVHAITIDNRVVRLIDTPGIGDTRGVQFDKKNMTDILQTLSNYETLHGILILVKSNNARLTITFNFCMKELLTHLHRSAAANVVFGFTNTRISNFTPGDTFGPLKTLVNEHQDVGIKLDLNTVYCFDSESFRYLAAAKNGVAMPNEEDFRRSWEQSQKEAWRLVDYFAAKRPHAVTSTVSMNAARQLIAELTKPMAHISNTIRLNIQNAEDQMAELTHTKLSGSALREKLHIQKTVIEAVKRDMPQTVCGHKDCIEFRDSGDDGGTKITVYNSLCHSPCFLNDVRADTVGAAGLMGCAAFRRSDTKKCSQCGHSWQVHLHFLYDLRESTVTAEDPHVLSQIQSNASDEDLLRTGIDNLQSRIKEFEDEHHQIREAAARFGIFLKANSITPYNDKTVEYLDMLIREEEQKVEHGGKRQRLDNLEADKRQHEELVAVMTKNMDTKQGPNKVLDEAGVDRLVHQLYDLPHFGEMLLGVRNIVVSATEGQYRERPHRVQGAGRAKGKNGMPKHPHPHPHDSGWSGSGYHEQGHTGGRGRDVNLDAWGNPIPSTQHRGRGRGRGGMYGRGRGQAHRPPSSSGQSTAESSTPSRFWRRFGL